MPADLFGTPLQRSRKGASLPLATLAACRSAPQNGRGIGGSSSGCVEE
jgi:hypothetical protein